MRLATERHMASQVGGRLLGSYGGGQFMESRAMYETVTGADTTLDFVDVLGRPCDKPNVAVGVHGGRLENPHTWMEHKLQL